MYFAGLSTHNYSLYAPVAGWVFAMVPHFYGIALYNKERSSGTGEWDNSNPRRNRDDGIKSAKLSPFMADRFLRAEAANDNSHVNLGFFCAALVAGNYARLSNQTLNSLAAAYLVSRIAFVYLYINGTSKLMGNLRSVAYLSGVISTLTLFVKSANKLY